MAIERLDDEELGDVSGGLVVEKPDHRGKANYFVVDDDGGGALYGVYSNQNAAKCTAHFNGVSDEVIHIRNYINRFGHDL